MELNGDQTRALEGVRRFLGSPCPCLLVHGGAGTGKTTLVAAIVAELLQRKRAVRLLAPTGRASRILGGKTGMVAETIHRVIYSLKDVEVFEEAEGTNDPGLRLIFPLKSDDAGNTVFIVDEASMVGDLEAEQDLLQFGSGRLLSDLIHYARIGRRGRAGGATAKILFVGDSSQLPPVRERKSPALSAEYLGREFSIDVTEVEFTEVMRQEAGSEILSRATAIRKSIADSRFNTFDCTPAVEEIVPVLAAQAVDHVANGYRSSAGNSVLVAYSNVQARDHNRAVRGRLWGMETAPMQSGDVLLVNSNSPSTGLFNGDLVKVRDIGATSEERMVAIRGVPGPVSLKFRRASLAYREADGSIRQIDCLVLENLLDSRERDLAPIEYRALLVDFRQRNPGLQPGTADFRTAIRGDTYFNALRVKYGYALTAHKAQGGEWDTVVVDFGDGRGKRNEEFFRWAYTAITRAKKTLLTINAPKFDQYSGMDWGGVGRGGETGGSKPDESGHTDRDPDWNRLSFAGGQEPLFDLHVKLRDAWSGVGITITELDHLQYCERYTVARGGSCAIVQYWYKGDLRPSRVGMPNNAAGDRGLSDEAITLMREALFDAPNPPVGEPEFIRLFRERIASAIAETEVRVLGFEYFPYRLRGRFEVGGHRSNIDFHYDGKERWTRVEEVGGVGASRGLVGRLQELVGSR